MTIKAFVFDWGNVLEIIDEESFLKKIIKKYNLNEEEFKKIEVEKRRRNTVGELSDKEYLHELNKDRIKDPGRLKIGQIIIIPVE